MVSKARAGAKAKQKADPMPADNTAAAPRTLSYSLKSKKAGRQLEVMVQIPRSTPSSVLSIEADEQGLRVDTGKWGGGYALAFEWPAPFTGKVRAGKDIEVEASLDPGRLQLCFDLEKPDAAVRPSPTSGLQEEENASKKRMREEPGPNKKKREKAKAKKKPNAVKGKIPGATTDGAAEAPTEAAVKKKVKRLVEDKKDVLALVESVGGAKEAQVEKKIAQERERNDKIAQIKYKQEQRKAAKVGKKEKLIETLKSSVKKEKRGKSVAAAAAAGTKNKGDGGGPAKKKRRVSWGADQEREFES